MLRLAGGLSRKDRISFYTSNDIATAIRKSNDEIDIKYGEKERKLTKADYILGIIFYIIPFAKALIIKPLIKNGIIGVDFYLMAALGYLFIAIFGIMQLRIIEGKEALKNHAAEHMVYSAYEKLKRVPTIEEAKKFSRINKDCGIVTYSGFITTQIIAFIVYIHTGYMISEIILFLIAISLRNIFPLNVLGKFAQLFTTSKPEDTNITLAITAISALQKKQEWKETISSVLNNI